MLENHDLPNGHGRLRSLTLVPKATGLARKDFKSDQVEEIFKKQTPDNPDPISWSGGA